MRNFCLFAVLLLAGYSLCGLWVCQQQADVLRNYCKIRFQVPAGCSLTVAGVRCSSGCCYCPGGYQGRAVWTKDGAPVAATDFTAEAGLWVPFPGPEQPLGQTS